MELSFIPIMGLRFDSNLGLTDAKYNSIVGLVGLLPGQSATDLKYDRLSKWKYTIGGQYDWNILGGSWSGNMSYTWKSFAYADVLNTPALAQPSYGVIDAGLSYKRKNVKYSLYGRNLQNTQYATGRTLGFNYFALGGEPRTYGIQVGVEFQSKVGQSYPLYCTEISRIEMDTDMRDHGEVFNIITTLTQLILGSR